MQRRAGVCRLLHYVKHRPGEERFQAGEQRRRVNTVVQQSRKIQPLGLGIALLQRLEFQHCTAAVIIHLDALEHAAQIRAVFCAGNGAKSTLASWHSDAYIFIQCGYKVHAFSISLPERQHNHWIGTTIFSTGSVVGGIKKTHDLSKRACDILHIYF